MKLAQILERIENARTGEAVKLIAVSKNVTTKEVLELFEQGQTSFGENRVQELKNKREILSNLSNVYLIDPLEYEKFVYLMSKSFFIITDSGGIQEEAPSLGKPVLVTRDTTERPEALQSGTVKLVGTNKNIIIDGKASERIVEFLKERA